MLTLKDQLEQEIRKRQMYIAHSSRAGNELAEVCDALDASLSKVARNPELDPILLEHESRKLDELVEMHSPKMSRRRSPTRALSPTRLAYTTGIPFSRSASLQRNPVPLCSAIRK